MTIPRPASPRWPRPADRLIGAALVGLAALAAAPACGGPAVPERPTWAHVEPILRGHCTHCHGSTAQETAARGAVAYRLDLYEVSPAVCGAAAEGRVGERLAHAWAPLIGQAVTPPRSGGRARMPPAPAPALEDWERETLRRWALAPDLGTPRRGNRRPQIRITSEVPAIADAHLEFAALVDDPDGEPVIGVLKIGDLALVIDRPGSFEASVPTAAWPVGLYATSAALCDGWDSVTYDLGQVIVVH